MAGSVNLALNRAHIHYLSIGAIMPRRGGSREKKTKSVRDLSRERALTPEDLNAFYAELVHGSDQACALIGCAFVDNALRDLLLTHMRDGWPEIQSVIFDELTAPLPSFYSRVMVAYAFNIIDDNARDQLNTIRRIRNAFAHSEKPITFAHHLIGDECASLDQGPAPTSRHHPNRVAYVRSCVNLSVDFGKEVAQRLERDALANALMSYEHPTSPDTPLQHTTRETRTPASNTAAPKLPPERSQG